ncbi:MAG: hypothetical protein KAX28_13560 [Candidatus Marinimicrobia bacterium]|nr:hypothetical protein [Candidatus Neomarinimicrobiota bacterium]
MALVIVLYTLKWEPYCQIMMWVGMAMIVISLISYFKVFLNIMKSPAGKEEMIVKKN